MKTNKIIVDKFFENHLNEAVKSLSLFNPDEVLALCKNLSNRNIYKLFGKLERYRAGKILESLDTKSAADIIQNIPAQTAVIILRQIKKEKLQAILALLSDKQAVQFTTMLHYDEYSVGAIMDPNVFTLVDDELVKDALEDLKRYEGNIPAQIFVVARDQKFIGLINLNELIRASNKEEIKFLVEKDVPNVFPEIGIKSVLEHEGWQKYFSLPVTDASNIFLGSISLEAIRKFIDKKSSKELKQVVAAGSALGELYRIGLSGLLRSAAEITTKPEE